MTLEQAKKLKVGNYIHHKAKKYKNGVGFLTARVTSVKTWKTRPDEVRIGFKYGLYEYGYLYQNDLHEFEVGDGRE